MPDYSIFGGCLRSAIAFPIPELPPVTMATLPVRSKLSMTDMNIIPFCHESQISAADEDQVSPVPRSLNEFGIGLVAARRPRQRRVQRIGAGRQRLVRVEGGGLSSGERHRGKSSSFPRLVRGQASVAKSARNIKAPAPSDSATITKWSLNGDLTKD